MDKMDRLFKKHFNLLSGLCCIIGCFMWSFNITNYPHLSYLMGVFIAFVGGINTSIYIAQMNGELDEQKD